MFYDQYIPKLIDRQHLAMICSISLLLFHLSPLFLNKVSRFKNITIEFLSMPCFFLFYYFIQFLPSSIKSFSLNDRFSKSFRTFFFSSNKTYSAVPGWQFANWLIIFLFNFIWILLNTFRFNIFQFSFFIVILLAGT